jgi:hypothetical protein
MNVPSNRAWNHTFYSKNKMAVTPLKINPQLDDKNRARLESKTYVKAYTDIPNKALPETYRLGLATIFKALTGEDFDMESNTFTVRADANGVFKRLYSPTVFSTEERGLVIRWGDRDIPLLVSTDKITTENIGKGTKLSFKEEQIGKYKEPALAVSATADGTLYTLPIPIRSADYEDKISVELLDLLLGENPEAIAEKVQIASDLSKRGESLGTGERMVGPFLKVAHLPLGEYNVTTYRAKEGGQYGTKYFMQVQVSEPFVAPIRTQVEGEWVTEEREVSDWAIVEPNNALKKTLAADPVITPDSPAVLKVTEHGDYNGFPTAKCVLRCQTFVEDPESFSLAF